MAAYAFLARNRALCGRHDLVYRPSAIDAWTTAAVKIAVLNHPLMRAESATVFSGGTSLKANGTAQVTSTPEPHCPYLGYADWISERLRRTRRIDISSLVHMVANTKTFGIFAARTRSNSTRSPRGYRATTRPHHTRYILKRKLYWW
jgi:hypothetical protein